MYDLLSNHLIAGLVGAAAFVAFLFSVGFIWNAIDWRLARPYVLASSRVSDDDIIMAIKDFLPRCRRRFFRPHVQGREHQNPRPPADESQVLAAEQRMGLPLPG